MASREQLAALALALATACGAKSGLRADDAGSGGSLATGGNSGSGGELPQAKADKIDLLFMIDASGSMGDKQQILALAIPDLVHRLTNPLCVDANRRPIANQPEKFTSACPAGSTRAFNPVQDLHIGVISSSLGGHGALSGCGPTGEANDRGRLLDRGARGRTYEDSGFLAWDPARTKRPPGETDPAELEGLVRDLVLGVGEGGCAAEASLEAWYRFLVDPEPPQSIELRPCASSPNGLCATAVGIDQQLLEQRKSFLRPDSLVAVVMLTDENDCSIRDEGAAYRVLEGEPMPRATSVCSVDPGSPCCHSCEDVTPRAGCPSAVTDGECLKGPYPSDSDSYYLRCFQQKRRFGIDALYPVTRYIDALTQPLVPRRDGALVENPLFSRQGSGQPARDPTLIFLAGIVGVPWQDIARDLRSETELHYKGARELAEQGVWDVILGDPERGQLPLDPLMIESIEQRSGTNPITGDPLAPASASSPRANPINGHEMLLDYAGIDLQYACIFDLPEPTNCGSAFCDCNNGFGSNKPICQDEQGNYGSVQYRAKAFPALRQLSVLKGIGQNAIVASICARNVTDPRRQDFGYRPALGAILDRLSVGLF